MSYGAKAKTQQITRRKSNLVKKADQLARLCHADLALIIRKNGKYYTYRSTETSTRFTEQLETLKDDIEDLLGRLQYTAIPQEWKLHVARLPLIPDRTQPR